MLNSAIHTKVLAALVFTLFLSTSARADVVCDGSNDSLDTGQTLSTFLSNTTGSLAIWYKPTGTAGSSQVGCFGGELLIGGYNGSGAVGLHRNGNYVGGLDRVCAWNDDGGVDDIPSAYTNNTPTHLVWVHSGGNLLFYKDGAQVSSVASGNTASLGPTLRICDGSGISAPYAQGTIARAQIFSAALSAAEVETLAKSQLRRIGNTAASGSWEMDVCGDGANCDTLVIADRSGNGRNLTATSGTGAASSWLTYPWGVE